MTNVPCKTVRIHQRTYDKIGRIADALRARASRGMAIPVRIDLGIVHMIDLAVDRLAKELKVQ